MLSLSEQQRLQAAHRLLAEKPKPRLVDPAHQSLPEWVATKLHLRAA